MSSWVVRLANKGRRGGSSVLVQIAREVVGRRRSIQGAISEVRHPAVLDALSDDDFKSLDELIVERLASDREFATVLARLTHAAAHAKGFDRQTVDAALRLDALLPAEDPSREREKLLRDAYRAAQNAGYVDGGRRALARLGQRAVAAGDGERAKVLLQQQIDLGPEQLDTADEVDSAILLGDILRRDGDTNGALTLFSRAARSGDRTGYAAGLAHATVREIDMRKATLDATELATLQERAIEAASRAGDMALESRMVANLASTLVGQGQLDRAIGQYELGLDLARRIGDLTLENHCLESLAHVERELGRLEEVATLEAERIELQERQGDRLAAAREALQHGSTLLSLGRLDQALAAYQRGVELARDAGDEGLEQRAYGGLGVAYSQSNMPVEALNHLMLALDLARANQDSTHEAQWLASIGEALWKFDQPEDAIKALRQAISAAEAIGDIELQAGTLSLLGQIHNSVRQPDLARQDYQTALGLVRQIGDVAAEIQTLSALGAIAMEGNAPLEAMRLYDEALQLAGRANQRAAAVRIYGRLARLAQRQGDNDAALEALEQAAVLANTLPDQRSLYGQALQHLAVAQDAAGMPISMDTYEEALNVSREVGDLYGETMMLVNIGARLLSLGVRDDGSQILQHAIRLADDLGPVGMRLRQRAEGLLLTVRTGDIPDSRRRRDATARNSGVVNSQPARSTDMPTATIAVQRSSTATRSVSPRS